MEGSRNRLYFTKAVWFAVQGSFICFFKITELLSALSLVDRCVQMGVCNHGCDVSGFRVFLRIIL